MATGKITKRSVEAIEPGVSDAFLWDDEVRGFGLRVTKNGARSYVYQFRLGGREAKTKRYTIGAHGSPWTPALARSEALRLAQLVRQGVDPIEANRRRRQEAVDLAFRAYVDRFEVGYLRARWKRVEPIMAMLRLDAVPVFRDRPISQIARGDFTELWDRLADRPAVARLMHATLRKMFRWAVGRGDIERSPLEGVEAPRRVQSRDRVLSDRELGIVWRAAAAAGTPWRALLRLLIVTGQRRDEVAGLDWGELDRAAAMWTLPGARAKNAERHFVPLSEQAIAVLDEHAGGEQWPRKGLVFTTTGETPVSGLSKVKRRLDAKIAELASSDDAGAIDFAEWRLHDLRRTVATGLQRLGVRFEVTEAVLNHVSGSRSGIAGVYQRHDWATEKRDALAAWGAHVEAAGA